VAQDAAQAHVGVIRFSNNTGSPSYDAVCAAATDTLTLALRQLRRYDVEPIDAADQGEAGLRALAEARRLDFVMYGSVSKGSAGGIVCSLAVFDRSKGKTAFSGSGKADGVLDIFDVADGLVVSVLESMTGAHIGFGAVTLRNTGEAGRFSVFVDGYPVGNDLESIDRVLIGRHTLSIAQRRMLGDREIAKATIDVAEGATAELPFAIPYLQDDEKAKLAGLRSSIQARWDDPNATGDVDAKVAELVSLLADVSYSPRLSESRDRATQLSGEWALQKVRLGIEAAAWDPKLELLESGAAIFSNAKAYPDPEKIRRIFKEEASLVSTLFELEGGKALADGDFEKGLACFGNALMVSTKHLGGARMTDYAYALTALQGLQSSADPAGTELGRDLKVVFGPWMAAGQRFYGLEGQAMAGTVCVLVASDFSTAVSVDGGDFMEAPLALRPSAESKAVSVQEKGAGTAMTITLAAGGRLLFVQDGFAQFGKVALSAAPGAIDVAVGRDGAVAFLDGGEEVDLPHVFENITAGDHVLTVRDVRSGSKIYAGFAETVAVEPGKRLVIHRELAIGKAMLRVEGLPQGATFTIDGEELPLAAGSDGKMLFSGSVDSGSPVIEAAQGNSIWYKKLDLAVNSSSSYSLSQLTQRVVLPRLSVRLQGRDDDFAGVESVFGATDFPVNGKISGSQIAGGRICRDAENLYIRIDFSNGAPDITVPSVRALRLSQKSYRFQTLQLQVNKEALGRASPTIFVLQTTNTSQNRRSFASGSYALGASFLELQFPLPRLSEYFDFSQPIIASLMFYTPDRTDNNESPPVEILIGK
jgi:hypothetical protein